MTALGELDVPAPRHRSRELTVRMCIGSSAIYTLTEAHRRAVVELAPQVAHRVWRLDPDGDVPEPVQASPRSYVDCARQIQVLVRHRLAEWAERYPSATSMAEGV